MKPAYKVNPSGLIQEGPEIVKVDYTDPTGLSWRDVKKALRQHYLDKAKALRSLTEKEFNTNGN